MSNDKRAEFKRWLQEPFRGFAPITLMRGVPIIFVLLCGTAVAAPSVKEERLGPDFEMRDTAMEDEGNERGLLYDDIEHDAKTDGFSSDIQEDCRNTMVRYRRSDGRVITRKVDRCY